MLVREGSPGLAKLSCPRLAAVHPRERLFLRLDECLKHTAAWVCGVPGAGKTTLLSSYVGARKLRTLWYRADSGDSDPAVVCHYLQLAARRTAPRAAGEIPAQGSAQAVDFESFFRRFFASFYACVGKARLLLIDDAQEALASAGFRQLLLAAISEAPDHIGLVIVSRTRPPGDFARLLANSELALLGPDELLFAEEESIAVQQLGKPMARGRATAQMRKLHQVTGGWAAGLKLLLQLDNPDSAAMASGQVVGDAALLDYLSSEVLDRQPEGVRSFLLKVAHLPHMTPSMASVLGGCADAPRILEAMHSDNLFTAMREVGGELHYEFHPLLRRFLLLRSRLALSDEERDRAARLAAALLAERGDADAAAQVLISAGHWEDLQRLIIDHAASLLDHGWHRTLSVWLDALPADWVANDSWLSYWQGAALAPQDPSAARAKFANAYRLFKERRAGDGSLLAWSAIVDQICLEWDDFSQLDHWLDEAAILHTAFGAPRAELAERFAASMFGALLFRRPDDPAIHGWADRLLSLIEACPDYSRRILLGCNLQIHYAVGVGLTVELGRLMKAVDPPAGSVLTPLAEILLCALRSIYLWSRGQSAEAADAAESGCRLARMSGVRVWDCLLNALQIYAWLNSGELARGCAALAQMERCLDPRRKLDVAHHHYLAALLSLSAEQGALALSHIQSANALAGRYGGPQQHALGSLAQAQALHAVQRRSEAWTCLERGRRIAQSMRSDMLCFQADLCAACFALDEGDDTRCAQALQSAFTVGAAQEYLNHHNFRPALMARLCAFALAHRIVPEYARRLIRQRGLAPPSVEVDHWPWPVRIYTLGRFSLVVDDQTVAESGARLQAKPIELLQTLITLGGRRIAIPILVETLWPEAESKGGRGAFESSLSRLRRLLRHDEALLIESGRLTLNPMLCWVDLWSLERLLGGIQAALHEPAQSDIAGLLVQTAKIQRLYQGEFLGREGCRCGALSLQDRLRARLENTLAEIGERLEAAADWEHAAKLHRQAIEIEPRAEKHYRGLMACLHRQGETAEALRVYARCRAALSSALRTVPSRETEAMRILMENTQKSALPPGVDN